MIQYNFDNPLNLDKSIPGSEITQDFENNYISPDGTFTELHAGVDKQKIGATSILTPDGYWQLMGKPSANGLVLQQVGTDLRMAIFHLNPTEVAKQTIGTIYGLNQVIIPYPDGMYGNTFGANPHVHFEFSNLFDGQRKFINPYSLQAGSFSTYLINGKPHYPQ